MATILGYVYCEKRAIANKLFTEKWFKEYYYIHIQHIVLNLDDLSLSELMEIKPSYWDKNKFWFEIPDKIIKDYIKRKERHLQKLKKILDETTIV